MKTTLTNSNLTATINNHGAELISLKSNVIGKEYMWEGNPEYWGKHSPILFPIVGTLKNNSFSYNDTTYQLPRHGFARDLVFNLLSKTDDEAVYSLQSNEETHIVYPFDFELQIIYTLKHFELHITYKVINKDSQIMYYSIGGHPALALHGKFEEYTLGFEANENLISYQLDNDLLSDNPIAIPLIKNQLPLTYALFEKDALIFKGLKSKQILLLENNLPVLNFKFADFPNFGIWTKINAPFICLEPWAGYSDLANASGNITDKEGIQKLEVNASKKYSFSIEIL